MIVMLLLELLYKIFSIFTTPINITSLPEDVSQFLTDAMEYINVGASILANYTDLSYLILLLGLIISIDIGISIYKFVMWVIRKIPLANIS